MRYDDAAAVYDALVAGELDAVLGAGVLEPAKVKELQYDPKFDVQHGAETQTVALIMNIADEDVRKTVVHAVNKNPIIESELSGFESPTGQLFSKNAPYCDVDLTPRFDYDLEKAEFLNCPESAVGGGGGDGGGGSKKKKKSSNDDAGLVGGLIAAAVVAIAALCCIGAMAKKEKEGKPVFAPVHNPVNERVAEKA